MYRKISPLGTRLGFGTYDTFFDTSKYRSIAEAEEANDLVIVNFVINDENVIYFEVFSTRNENKKEYLRLQIQHFPFGVDAGDDNAVAALAISFYNREDIAL